VAVVSVVVWEWGFKMKTKYFIPVLLILIVSCTPFSREVMQEVKRDITFGEVAKAPETFKGEAVIWGGVIIETIPRTGDTLLIIRQTELDFLKRPRNLDKSEGRFIIQYQGFLDPAIYSKDREVTVAGIIEGKEERLIGEHRYAYPVVKSRALNLWEKWEDTPYYYDPWYYWNPFYNPWGYYPRYRY